MNEERMGYSSGWTVEEDADGSFRWTAFGPAGTLRGQAKTRAEAEKVAREAEQELAAKPGAPGTPRVRLSSRPPRIEDSTVPEGGSELQPARIEQLLDRAHAWAREQPDIRGLALVGSWARGSARTDSDVDLVVLTTASERYLSDDEWSAALGATRVLPTQAWGPLTERRLLLEGGLEVEVGIAEPAWAATDPVDRGTRRVVTGGMRILYDPDGRLATLAVAASEDQP
jgi:predicted nucleotidyltransferase